ncbi:hypothetical protein M9H77_30238 [Catharanthus roseus]|uniref:Uncharacterized protein n=1 Tax=Catharanthus roseus TaxID=4058 RepID=A0ACB9ZX26_CATRO|nr:hypothetical protein M9H77_30238 [Catharanthus roseus]
MSCDIEVWLRKFERIKKGSTMKRKFDTGQKRKRTPCRECEGYSHLQVECANTLKKNRSLNTTLSDDKKKSDSEDDEEDTDSNEKLAFNVIIDLEATSMQMDHKDDNDDDSIYNDKEVSYKELQDKYSLLYTKWIGRVKLHKN